MIYFLFFIKCYFCNLTILTNNEFKPHFDGCVVEDNQIRSIFTLLIYLNEAYLSYSSLSFNLFMQYIFDYYLATLAEKLNFITTTVNSFIRQFLLLL